MEMNKLIRFSITSVIVIVLTASLLMPVIEDATNGYTTTYYNMGGSGLYFTDEDGHTITYTAGGTSITVDDEEYTLGTTTVYAISDAMIVLANTNGITVYNGTTKALSNYTTTDATVTFTDGTASLIVGDTTTTATYTWSRVANPEGEYVLTSVGEGTTVYYNDINEISTAQVYGGKQIILYKNEASLSGVEATVTMTTVQQSGTNGKVMYISGAISISDGETTVAPTYVSAKASVTYESPLGKEMGALLAPLPILIIISLVVAAAGIAVTKRD